MCIPRPRGEYPAKCDMPRRSLDTREETNMKTYEFQSDEIQTTQTQLVTAAQQGDREAFGRLFEQFQRDVLRDRLPPAGRPRRGAGSLPGSVHPGHAEDRPAPRSAVLRRLAALDGQPDGDEPGRARSAHAGPCRRRSRSPAAGQQTPLGDVLAAREPGRRSTRAWIGSRRWTARRSWPSTSMAAR